MTADARAAILAGALATTPLPEALFERHLRVPAIRLIVPQQRPPLDLDAAIFRYIVTVDGSVRVNDEPAGARRCAVSEPECRSTRSSSAASRRYRRHR